jgi:alpha-L-fucosidase
MANKKTYQRWQAAAAEAAEIAKDKTLPLWKKAHLVSTPYTGIALDELQSKHRRKIISGFARVNGILARYEPNLKTFDDYKIIEEQDLRDIVSIVKSLSPM